MTQEQPAAPTTWPPSDGSDADDSTGQASVDRPAGTDAPAVDMGGERVKLKVVTPQIVDVAKTFLTLPMGDERYAEVDGRRYVFVLEWHYHPPGFVGGPNGWHKGVTVYELK